jgi:hypothetical protein
LSASDLIRNSSIVRPSGDLTKLRQCQFWRPNVCRRKCRLGSTLTLVCQHIYTSGSVSRA